jgi:hypothetical protein
MEQSGYLQFAASDRSVFLAMGYNINQLKTYLSRDGGVRYTLRENAATAASFTPPTTQIARSTLFLEGNSVNVEGEVLLSDVKAKGAELSSALGIGLHKALDAARMSVWETYNAMADKTRAIAFPSAWSGGDAPPPGLFPLQFRRMAANEKRMAMELNQNLTYGYVGLVKFQPDNQFGFPETSLALANARGNIAHSTVESVRDTGFEGKAIQIQLLNVPLRRFLIENGRITGPLMAIIEEHPDGNKIDFSCPNVIGAVQSYNEIRLLLKPRHYATTARISNFLIEYRLALEVRVCVCRH